MFLPQFFVTAAPPDVRRWLCPAVTTPKKFGATPWFESGVAGIIERAEPQVVISNSCGGAKPPPHIGGHSPNGGFFNQNG
jgi:hypothetical protein